MSKRTRESCIRALNEVREGETISFHELAQLSGCNNASAMSRAVKKLKTSEAPWWRVVGSGKKTVKALVPKERQAEQLAFLKAEMNIDAKKAKPAILKDLVPGQIIEPRGLHQKSLIYLHGFGAAGSLKNAKQFGNQKNLRVILPHAPKRAVTYCDGELDNAWFDYKVEKFTNNPEEWSLEHLEEQVARILRIVDREVAAVGAKNVFLGGTSQGCLTGLDAYMKCKHELGGFVGTVGALLSTTEVVERSGVVHLISGWWDDVHPLTLCRQSYARLAHLPGVQFFEEPMDHYDGCGREAEFIRGFLAKVGEQDPMRTALTTDVASVVSDNEDADMASPPTLLTGTGLPSTVPPTVSTDHEGYKFQRWNEWNNWLQKQSPNTGSTTRVGDDSETEVDANLSDWETESEC